MNLTKYFLKVNRPLVISFLLTFILAIILTTITNLYFVQCYYLTIFPIWLTYTKELSYFFELISIVILLILTFKTFFGKNRSFIIKFFGKKKYLIFLGIFNIIIFILIFICMCLSNYTIQMHNFIFDNNAFTQPNLYFQFISCFKDFIYIFILIMYINILFYVVLICKEFYQNSKYKYFSVKKRLLHLIVLIITYIFKISLLLYFINIIALSDITQLYWTSIISAYVPINSYFIILGSICMFFIIFLDYVKYFLDEIYI